SWRRSWDRGASRSTSSRRDRPIRNCLGRERQSKTSSGSPSWQLWGDSGSRRTSPTWWLCWSAMMPTGSLDRTFEPTAGLSEQRGASALGLSQDNESESVVSNPVAADRSIAPPTETTRNICFLDCLVHLSTVRITEVVKP